MIVRLVLAAALLLPVGAKAASPQPTDKMYSEAVELFVRFVGRGENEERTVYLLSMYFGQEFGTRRWEAGRTDYFLIRRDPESQDITYYRIIGTRETP